MVKKNNWLLWAVIVMSVVSVITSIYLTNSHFADPDDDHSFCDINAAVSCSLVNTSVFSEILHVPVAVLGIIWSVLLGLLAWRAIQNRKLLKVLVAWNVVGLGSVFYLVTAEIILKALCPFCTLVHIIVLLSLGISIYLYKQEKPLKNKEFVQLLKPWLLAAIILTLAAFAFYNIGGSSQDHSQLAQCINEKGVNMYGSFRCGVCARTRAMFGDAFEHINEIECHPQGENAQTELCVEKGIEGTPTWILEPSGVEEKRHTGFLDTVQLAEFAGCE